jgi:hypothetical protein
MLSKTITSKDIYLNGKPQRTIKVAVHSKGEDGKWKNNVQYMTPSQIGQYSCPRFRQETPRVNGSFQTVQDFELSDVAGEIM